MDTVFLQYDQVGLDAQYDLRARVPDTAYHLRFRETESARVRGALTCRLDLAYGAHAGERLDVFPADRRGAPALVFIHGGYWRGSDKSDASYMAPDFVAAGVTVVTVNYALAPVVAMDEIVRQNRAALAWVWRNAATLGIDRDRIHVAGHSAGGHLTAMMLATDWAAFDADLPRDLVKGACALSGIYDLEPIRLSFLNADVRLDRESARRNSPIHLAPHCAAPLILSVGALETEEYHRQEARFAAAWRAHLPALDIVAAPDCHHYNIVPWFGRAGTALFEAMHRLIGPAG
ncbi:MAG: alpha/beta hydrolase [Alphaproteobacteria bacterium]|nr:alpha/beta hydrolase [Alphaproteobacteria bacterium]